MANEINVITTTGLTLTYDLRVGATAELAAQSLPETAVTGYYSASVPGGVDAGYYTVLINGASGLIGIGELRWDGSAEVLPATVAQGTSVLANLAVVDGVVDDILLDTAVIGTAGAGLTAIPWNAAWDTEVQSECTDALNAYDPPTAAEMDARTILAANYATAANLAIVDGIVDDILVDTAVIGAAGAGLTALPWNAAWDAEVQSECTDALNAYDPPTNAEMEARTLVAAGYASPTNITAGTIANVSNRVTANVDQIAGSATAATNLSRSALAAVYGTAITGTLSTTQMTTNLTETTTDHYIGRVVIWTTGALTGQASDVTAYNGTTKMLTYTATTDAPSNGDLWVMV